MDHIDAHLATAAVEYDYPLAIKAALAIAKKTLNRYYDKTDHSEVFRIAMGIRFLLFIFFTYFLIIYFLVLHPRHKLQYFEKEGWTAEWITSAKEIVRAAFDLSYGSLDDMSWAASEQKVCTYLITWTV